MTIDNKLVEFQGNMVPQQWRDAYMDGYRHPRAANPYGKYSDAKEAGQTARRQQDSWEGSF